jgi:uncharacterized protein (TIGR02145 family)
MRSSRIILLAISVVFFNSCKKRNDPRSEFSKIVDYNSATIICEGISHGDEVLERGFCWGTNVSPTIFDNKIVSGSGEGNYTVSIENLVHGAEYHIRSYCASRLKISYSDEKVLKTVADPTLSVYFPSVITNTSFVFGGFISSPYALFEGGICYGLNPNPTVSNFTTSIPLAAGLFSCSVTDLTPNTTFYYRAFAKVGAAIFYSENQAMVKTYYSTVTDVDSNVYYTVLIGSQEWMAENLRVEHFQNGAPLSYCILAGWETSPNTTGLYGSYDDDDSLKSIYGHLYDGKAVRSVVSIAPIGWRIPSYNDWVTLSNYLGGDNYAGGEMIKASFYGFHDGLYFNSSGFSVIMGGQRNYNGIDYGLIASTHSTTFWTDSFDVAGYLGFYRRLSYGSHTLQSGSSPTRSGYYVRCIKN